MGKKLTQLKYAFALAATVGIGYAGYDAYQKGTNNGTPDEAAQPTSDQTGGQTTAHTTPKAPPLYKVEEPSAPKVADKSAASQATEKPTTPQKPKTTESEAVKQLGQNTQTLNLGNGFGLKFSSSTALYDFATEQLNKPFDDPKSDRTGYKTPELHSALRALAAVTPLRYQTLEAAVWTETRFLDQQENKDSNAKGYFQMKPDTFYEGLYFAAPNYPQLKSVTDLIERTREKQKDGKYILSYEPVDNTAKAKLDKLVHDPFIAGISFYGYLHHYMRDYVQEKLPGLTEPNQTDYYLISFRGPRGAAEFLKNLRDNPAKPAYSMYGKGKSSQFVIDNKSVYYDAAKKHWRSYQEVYDYLANDMGLGKAPVNMDAERAKSVALVTIPQGDKQPMLAANNMLFTQYFAAPFPPPSRPTDLEKNTDNQENVSTRPPARPDGLAERYNTARGGAEPSKPDAGTAALEDTASPSHSDSELAVTESPRPRARPDGLGQKK